MERDIGFNLDRRLWEWTVQMKKVPDITEADSEELKCHLLDSAEHWERAGLDQEEAFWVASRRLRLSFDLVEDYHTVNSRLLQMEKTVLVLAGVLGFFLSYYFLVCSSMLLFYGLTVFDVSGDIALRWITNYLYGAQFVFVTFVAALMFMEKKFLLLAGRVRLKPKHTLLLLLITLLFAMGSQYLFPEIREIGKAQRFWGQLFDVFFYFRFSFPALLCLSFVFLYNRYGRKLVKAAEGVVPNDRHEEENGTDLSEQINQWCNAYQLNAGICHCNPGELKIRILDLMNELKSLDLNAKEAFGIAAKRLGSGHFQWKDSSLGADDSVMQMKSSFLILAGIPIYFLLYYFFRSTSKFLFIILKSVELETQISLSWVSSYLTVICFVFLFFSISVYFFEKKTISFIEAFEAKPKYLFFIFIITLAFVIADVCFMSISKGLIEPDNVIKTNFVQIFRNFDHAFPLIACVSFVILYLKYYRETRI